MAPRSSTRDVFSIARDQKEWRRDRCLNLIPSENVTSPHVRRLLASDFGHRYSLPLNAEIHGEFVENAYRGTRYLDEVESLGEDLTRELFGGGYASLKPLSGHICGLVSLTATCRPGDRFLVISPKNGGYDGYGPAYLPSLLGLEVEYLPFDASSWNIKLEEACDAIRAVRPSLVLLGASFILFPYDLGPIRDACDSAEAFLGYDASHILGLIAGGEFQAPLQEGVDVVFGSTHKSLFGPQGGLMVARKGLAERINESITWKALDNAHWNRIAALTQALVETKAFGTAYAKAVVQNARRLARALEETGIPVRFPDEGYTRSPMLLLDGPAVRREFGLSLNDLAATLEKCDVIVDAVGRLGTNEVTRMGATEGTMEEIADCIRRCAEGEDVKGDVARIRRSLSLTFCFEDR